MNGTQVEFHIDPGVEVTVISRKIYNELDQPPLQRSGKALKGPGNHNLTVMRSRFKGKLTKINCEVVSKKSLLLTSCVSVDLDYQQLKH